MTRHMPACLWMPRPGWTGPVLPHRSVRRPD
jgi:hypothetical protein